MFAPSTSAEGRSPLVGIRTTLHVFELERREMPSGNTPWPITPAQGMSLDLAETYGQFSDGGGLHFHEGIDIIAAAGTTVKAVEAGTISALNTTNADPQKLIEISTGVDAAKSGWSYIHITRENNARTGAPYILGEAVGPANKAAGLVDNLTIAKVAPQGGWWADHLHLASGEGEDPAYLDDYVGIAPNKLLRPTKDPLDRLTAIGDAVAPTVEEVLFRAGGSDGIGTLYGGKAITQGAKITVINQTEARPDLRYFVTRDVAGNAIIVGANSSTNTLTTAGLAGDAGIDIVGKAYDKIRTGVNAVYKLGVKSIGFSIQGQRVNTSKLTVDKSFDFTGEFAPDDDFGGGSQTYVSLHNAQQVRAVYSNDLRSKSIDGVQYYYTVTNNDNDLKVQATDRNRQWYSKKASPAGWNNMNAQDAVNNAKSSWPDDYYEIEVTARDEAGNIGTKKEKVLLDNWTQTLEGRLIAMGVNTYFVQFTGAQWTANSTVKIYLMTGGVTDGDTITNSGTLLGTANTDANGNIVATTFEVPATNFPGPFPNYFLADYHNGDNKYQPRLDATSLLIEDNGLPNGMSISPGGFAALMSDPNFDPDSDPVSESEPVLPVQDWMPPTDQALPAESGSPVQTTDATALIRALIGEPASDFGLVDRLSWPDRFDTGV